MSDEHNTPIHEQVYRIVVEGQEAEKQRANAWRGGTNFGRSSFAQLGALIGVVIAAFGFHADGILELILQPLAGVLIGGFCGWLFGQALRFLGRALGFVFITLPMKVISAIRGNRS
ncbi:MAG: hypothetical protein ACKVP2_16120 [Burkholderiales bacterium]